MPAIQRPGRLIAAAVLAGVMTGCGSTVGIADRSSGARAVGADGLSALNLHDEATVPASGATAPASAVSDSASSTGPEKGVASSAGELNDPLRASGSNAQAPGAAGPVQIGFVVTKNNAGAGAALGFNVNNGDERAVVQTLVDAANKAGGLLHHPITPIYYELDPSTSKSFDTLGQEVCAAFTQDAHVTAALGTALFDTANTCLSSRGVPAINGSTQSSYSEAELGRMSSVVVYGVPPTRQARGIVAAVERQGFFSRRPKVGVVTIDAPRYRDAVESTLLPQLRGAGAQAEDANVVYAPAVTAVSDVASVATSMQSAVLRMRSAGVTHVVFLTNAAVYALLFMEQANQQGSAFKYALSSNDAPAVLGSQGVPEKQLAGVVAAGWDPYLDVSPGKAGGTPSGRGACDRTLAKLKLQPGSNGEWVAHMHCDAFHALTEASGKAVGALSRASLMRALSNLGPIDSTDTWKASIFPTHRWAVAGVRASHYAQACSCFLYVDKRLDSV